MRPAIASIGAAMLLLGACRVGPNIETFEPARRAEGTQATLRFQVDGRTFTRVGELIAVRGADFLILTERGVESVPHGLMESAEFEDARPGRIRRAGGDGDRRSIAHYSRYPLGLPDAQLGALLEALGQDALIEVAP
jgi:hypothetical protein